MADHPPDEFTRRARNFTLNRLFLGDMLLNWFLGIVLIAFPTFVDRLVGAAGTPIVPLMVYRAIGTIFLLFATWQTVVIARQKLGLAALVFACLMAEVPVVLLTIALVYMDLPLRPVWRAILWVGNGYMLFLGAWYLFLARRLARAAP